ncbi:hypothetical protein D9756_000025 [Leucocoprinus leucothites]|uniref:Uncharacterized protein n=1 Tax=Leucocoprinus leucothites TaxID=201217 RepID=A0A8H5GFE8_9AGAR|nr:hypothetical protein D9756_000025 [Leucoagaricus leucothites]
MRGSIKTSSDLKNLSQQPLRLPPTSTPTPTSTTPPSPESSDPPSSPPPSIALPPLTEFNYSLGILLSSLQWLAFIPSPLDNITTTYYPLNNDNAVDFHVGSSNAVHINCSTSHHPNSIRYSGGVNRDSSSYSSTKYWRYRLGGIVGLSVVALIVRFLLRKCRQSEDDEFDGKFEPARPGGAGITPYPFQHEILQHLARPSMDQRPLIGAAGAAAAVGAYNPYVMVIFLQENKEALLPGVDAPTPPHGMHGSPPPPPGTAQSDSGYTTSSDPSPNAVSADYFGHGPSPGPSVPPSEVGSSGHGYEMFGVGTARLREWGRAIPMPMAFHYPHRQQQYPRSSASPPLPSHSLAPSTSTPSPPPPGWAEGEKAVMLGRSEAAVGNGMIVHQDAGKVAEEERSGGEKFRLHIVLMHLLQTGSTRFTNYFAPRDFSNCTLYGH